MTLSSFFFLTVRGKLSGFDAYAVIMESYGVIILGFVRACWWIWFVHINLPNPESITFETTPLTASSIPNPSLNNGRHDGFELQNAGPWRVSHWLRSQKIDLYTAV